MGLLRPTRSANDPRQRPSRHVVCAHHAARHQDPTLSTDPMSELGLRRSDPSVGTQVLGENAEAESRQARGSGAELRLRKVMVLGRQHGIRESEDLNQHEMVDGVDVVDIDLVGVDLERVIQMLVHKR